MAAAHVADASRRPHGTPRPYATGAPIILPGVEVVREGRVEPFLQADPTLSSAAVCWAGIAVEDYSLPACVIPRHEHVESFLHVVLRGSVRYEVLTRGKTLQFGANPGTTFILPRGTIDELRWAGPTHRIAVAIHPSLLVNAIDETAHESDVELTEHWNLTDPHIMAVLLAMKTDLAAGSPAGRLYGESLANALAVYLLNRYAVRRYAPVACRGGLPGYRLRRVLEHIGDNLADDLSLAQLAAVAGMSTHYFAELFSRSTGHAPHRYVLLQRMVIMHLTYPPHDVESAEQASADDRVERPVVVLTPHMVAAGVDVYRRWDEEEEDVECLIAEIFLSTHDARALKPYRNSSMMMASSLFVSSEFTVNAAAASNSIKKGLIAPGM